MLTPREKEIVALISLGNTNKVIADKLYVSEHTVNTHRKNVFEKIGAKNTAGLVLYAVKTNLVNLEKVRFLS